MTSVAKHRVDVRSINESIPLLMSCIKSCLDIYNKSLIDILRPSIRVLKVDGISIAIYMYVNSPSAEGYLVYDLKLNLIPISTRTINNTSIHSYLDSLSEVEFYNLIQRTKRTYDTVNALVTSKKSRGRESKKYLGKRSNMRLYDDMPF